MQTIDQDTGEIIAYQSLAHYESIIARGLQTFYDVGNALMAIRDSGKYKEVGYKSFEAYCDERWSLKKGHAYRLIDSANIVDNITNVSDRRPLLPKSQSLPAIRPESEWQVRPLIAFRDTPDLQRLAWQRAIEAAPDGRVTAAIVEQAVVTLAEELREKAPAPPLPEGKYRCIVIDPPWEMDKIARDVRPKQVTLDYPQMSEAELLAFPIPDLASDDCHLYLWTTHKYLPLALRLAEHWGFRYQCLMTWVKNVGFTPFSWMYSTEHALFCRRGDLDLLQLGKRLDIHAPVREHSRKPDEFYDLIQTVSPGPRLDIFAREQHEGFEVWGNEVGHFERDGNGNIPD